MGFKSVNDIKKTLTVGSFWHCKHHGGAMFPPKDMGTREVSIVQSAKFAFKTTKEDGTVSDSWCDFPKKNEVIFHDSTPPSFTITESGKPLLTYTMQPQREELPPPPAEIDIKTTPATVTPTTNPQPATDTPKEVHKMSTVTRKELIALATRVNTIMGLTDADAIDLSTKATIATLTTAITDLSNEFTTADFAETTEEAFRFSTEEVATLGKIGITPPQPKEVRRNLSGGKKVKKSRNGNGTPKKDAYTRTHALKDALMNGGTKKAIVEYSDKLYREKNPGAKAENSKKPFFVAEVMFRYTMPLLLLMGFCTVTADKEPVYALSHDTIK